MSQLHHVVFDEKDDITDYHRLLLPLVDHSPSHNEDSYFGVTSNRHKRLVEYSLLRYYLLTIRLDGGGETNEELNQRLSEIMTRVNLNNILYSLVSELVVNNDNFPIVKEALKSKRNVIYRWNQITKSNRDFDSAMPPLDINDEVPAHDKVDDTNPLKRAISETCKEIMVLKDYAFSAIQLAYHNYTKKFRKYYIVNNKVNTTIQYREYAIESHKKKGQPYLLKTFISVPDGWNGIDKFRDSLNIYDKVVQPSKVEDKGVDLLDEITSNVCFALYEMIDETDENAGTLGTIYGFINYKSYSKSNLFGKHIWLDIICSHTQIISKVKGIGSFMLNFMILQAHKQGHDTIVLSVSSQSWSDSKQVDDTQKFYRNKGFVPTHIMIESDTGRKKDKEQDSYYVLKLDITNSLIDEIVENMYINSGNSTTRLIVGLEASFDDVLPEQRKKYRQTVVTPNDYFSRVVKLLDRSYYHEYDYDSE